MYIGATGGPEKAAVKKFIADNSLHHMKFEEIAAGKLRRYFSFQNFVDAFKVPVGIVQAMRLIRRFDPEVVFSKGGFVTVPVVIGAGIVNFGRRGRKKKIPIIVHESDLVPGLANKISARFASRILLSFEKSRDYFVEKKGRGGNGRKVEVLGNPIREDLMKGEADKGRKICGFHKFKPIVLVMGGSLGAAQVNHLVWDNLGPLLKKYQIVHITGKGHLKFGADKEGYKQFELLFEELKHVYAASSLVVTRGGANALAEVAALEKSAVIIPLGTASSRGDQIVNAKFCAEEYGWQNLVGEVSGERFLHAIDIAVGTPFAGEDVLHKRASKAIFELLFNLTKMDK